MPISLVSEISRDLVSKSSTHVIGQHDMSSNLREHFVGKSSESSLARNLSRAPWAITSPRAFCFANVGYVWGAISAGGPQQTRGAKTIARSQRGGRLNRTGLVSQGSGQTTESRSSLSPLAKPSNTIHKGRRRRVGRSTRCVSTPSPRIHSAAVACQTAWRHSAAVAAPLPDAE